MSITKYWLDFKDRIIRTNLIWDNFAEDNEGGDRSFSDEIIGKSLFSFISGDATKMYISTMIQRVRLTNKMLDIDYRCDSPEMKRFMRMKIVPEGEGVIRVENLMEKEEPQKKPVRFTDSNRKTIIKKCSMCQKVNSNNEWLEADEIENIELFAEGGEEVPVIYTVCNSCNRNLGQRMKSIQSVRQRLPH